MTCSGWTTAVPLRVVMVLSAVLCATSTHGQASPGNDNDCRPGFTAEFQCAIIPRRVPPGHTVLSLPFRSCGMPGSRFTVRPPSLRVTSRGELVTSRPVTLAAGAALRVTVRARGASGRGTWRSDTRVLVRPRSEGDTELSPCPSRVRREWKPPVPHITENDSGPYPAFVTKYTSDRMQQYNIVYKLTGPGVDEEPVGLFYMGDHGRIYVRKPVDREAMPVFNMLVHAYNPQGEDVEKPASMTVIVTDENDETPQFSKKTFTGTVEENRPAGTTVLVVEATDADDPTTDHVIIVYEIVSQKPPAPKAFAIGRSSGSITTLAKLDREDVRQFVLEVRASDCNGSPQALSNTTTVTVLVGDVNDSPPAFSSPTYEATVRENEVVARAAVLDVRDADEVGSPAWRAVYTIARGNDGENFAIATDVKTNQGVLSVVKPLNFEAVTTADKTIPLVVTVENEEKLQAGGAASPSTASGTATVLVHISDVNEDPAFDSPTKVVRCEEGAPLGTPLGVYTAQDPDIGDSKSLMYSVESDKAGWLAIDRQTGALTMAGDVDRENAEHVQNDRYNATIIAVDPGHPDFTCTGTVIMDIVDVNDLAPRLMGPKPVTHGSIPFLCLGRPNKGLPLVGIDADSPAHGPPLDFHLLDEPPGTKQLWEVVSLNATSAQLQERESPSSRGPPPGTYKLSVLLRDQGGLGEVQHVTVRACHCLGLLKDSGCVTPAGSAGLGFDGAAGIVFPVLALTLLGILCCCFCRQQRLTLKVPDVWSESLVHYNQEGGGGGEDVREDLTGRPTARTSLDHNHDRDAPFTKLGGLSTP